MPTTQSDTFENRLRAIDYELRHLFLGLYHNEEAYDAFVALLRARHEERSRSLRALDERRIANPHWFKGREQLGYALYTDQFAGNLRGVRKHLPYLKRTGVTCLHLMPLLESPEGRSDGGYAVSDYRNVQPELGTMADLRRLCADCHAQDMAVCVDFVMNHTSEDHEWARRAAAGEEEYQARYFFYDNWDEPRELERGLPEVFPATAPGNFTECPEAGKVVMTTFYPYQWDLNYRNPAVLEAMADNLLYLANQGIDILRLDAVPYIWKQRGTNCRNLPEVHVIVRILRLACEAVCPGVLLLGEVVMEPDKVAPYFGTPAQPECHLLYNVTTMCTLWHTVATADTRLLREQLAKVFELPRACTFLNYLRCHDDIGWGLDYPFLKKLGMEETAHKLFLNRWFCGAYGGPSRGELYNDDPRLGDARLCGTTASLCGMEVAPEEGLTLDVMLHALLLTQSGLPIIYSGDEVAHLNDNSYHENPLRAEDSRYLHRGAFDWSAADEIAAGETPGARLYQAIARLREVRAAQDVFHPDADCWAWDTGNNAVLALGRYHEGSKLLAFFNFSDEPQSYFVGYDEEYADLLTGERFCNGPFGLEPHGFRWLLHEPEPLRPLPGADDSEAFGLPKASAKASVPSGSPWRRRSSRGHGSRARGWKRARAALRKRRDTA